MPFELSNRQIKIIDIVGVTFIGTMVTLGVVAAPTASACRNDMYHGEKKVRFCTITLYAGAPFADKPGRRARHFLERGIALTELGRMGEAMADFRRAVRDTAPTDDVGIGTSMRNTFRQRLLERIAQEDPASAARKAFEEALRQG